MDEAQNKAIWIVNQIFKKLIVKVGEREMEVEGQIKRLLKKFGGKPAFRTIIASGKRSMHPHGRATTRRIRRGDMLVIDFGALYKGYRSDITRTIFIGKPEREHKKVFKIVLEAQKRASHEVREGAICSHVDRAARDYISRKGYGKYFVHTTGHGIGKKVHEGPKISEKNRRKLKAGMVITLEPGIYIKGWGGVRIEDMYLVTKRGHKKLTHAPVGLHLHQ